MPMRNPFDFGSSYSPKSRRSYFSGSPQDPTQENQRRFISQTSYQKPDAQAPEEVRPPDSEWGSWMSEMKDAYTKEGPAAASYREHLDTVPQYQNPSKWGKLGAALVGGAEGYRSGGAAGFRAAQEVHQTPYRRELDQWGMKEQALGRQAGLEEKQSGNRIQFMQQVRSMAKDEQQAKQWMADYDHKTWLENNDEAERTWGHARAGATKAIGDSMQVLAESTFPEEARWLSEMLAWPVQWSSLHGVAIITTPVVRVVTSTDALAEKVIINKIGTSYPAEGAAGVEFPFQATYPIKLNRRSVDLHTDNGFDSEPAMETAHSALLRALYTVEVPTISRIIDLGCGNGLLLEKVGKKFLPTTDLIGIDIDKLKCQRAIKRLEGKGIQIYYGDIRQYHHWFPPYSLVMIALNRLFEMPITRAHDLLEKIAHGTDYLLCYSYDGQEFNISWSDHYRMEYTHCQEPVPGATVVYLLRSLYIPVQS